MSVTTAQRPLGVTVVGILAIVQGILTLLAGLALAIEHNDHDLILEVGRSSRNILSLGIGALIVGAITLLLGFALLGGSNFARWFIGVVEIFHLAGGIYVLFAYDGTDRWNGVASIVIAALILFWLFGSDRAEAFFHRTG